MSVISCCRWQVGKGELETKGAMLAGRFTGTKVPWAGDVSTFGAFVKQELATIQAAMLEKATADRNSKLKVVSKRKMKPCMLRRGNS